MKKRKSPAVKNVARPRGGTSIPCPDCGRPTRVVDTRRSLWTVTRQRECTHGECHRNFVTHERQVD